VTLDGTEEPGGPSPAVLLAVLIVVAIALRVYRLGAWGFEGDEIFTLRDSLHLQFDNPRPLLYLLNHYVVRPFLPLNELGLRVVPALSGVLAIPALYIMARRLVGTRAALFAALLLTVSPVHVYQSQYARYWSLVFLLSAVYPYAIYLGITRRSAGYIALGIVTAILAVLSHPVAVLLMGGLGAWFAATDDSRGYLRRLWHHRTLRWAALTVVVLAALATIRYLPVLGEWITTHDEGGTGDNLLHLPGRPVIKQLALMASYLEGVTLPVALAGLIGVALLWQRRDRPLAAFLACLFLVPVALLVGLSFRTPISTTYLLPAAPVLFIGAGVFLDHLTGIEWNMRPRWLMPATIILFILIAGLPTLVSQYRDGRRRDFRSAARFLSERIHPGDVVYSDQASVLSHYLPNGDVERLVADPSLLQRAVHGVEASARGEAVWIVLPASAQGGLKTTARVGTMTEWIYENCQLRNTVGVARLDFRQNQLQVYRCPAVPPLAGGSNPE
jgi:mannosyltransferase